MTQTPTTPPPSTPPPATPPPAQPPANPQAPPNPPAPPANPQTTSTPPPTADDGKDLGFPPDTPVSEMTDKQQAAYHRHKREQNREVTRQWKAVTGDRTPEQLQADLNELAELRRSKMTDAERAVEDAKNQTASSVRVEAGKDAARVALEFAIGHNPESPDSADDAVWLDTLDLSKFLTSEGKVDTDKVRSVAATRIRPGKGGAAPDFGAGRRGGGSGKTGVAAGRALYEESRPKKTTSTT